MSQNALMHQLVACIGASLPHGAASDVIVANMHEHVDEVFPAPAGDTDEDQDDDQGALLMPSGAVIA